MRLHKNDGMSLVELMVVIAILMALGAAASTQYDKYKRRAKLMGARKELSTLYSMEVLFHSEYVSYTSRLDSLGYKSADQMIFDVGFDEDFAPPSDAPQGSSTCLSTCSATACTYPIGGRCTPSAAFGLDGTSKATATRFTFRATAHAHLNETQGSGNAVDAVSFTIDERKNLQMLPTAD